jgi:ubiquitin C-terminal hydrolase
MAHHSMVHDDSSMQKYDLYAVCNHSGTLQLGHYYAYCKRTESDGSEKWYNFDDSRITEIDESEVVTEDAYILFYIRQSK